MNGNLMYRTFAAKMFHPDSKYLPKILKSMINDQQMELLLSLPGSVNELAKKLDSPGEQVQKDLDDMYRKGLVFKKTKSGKEIWRGPAHIAQLHDATIVWPEATEEFLYLWQQYMEYEWPKIAPTFACVMPRPYTRVIPVEKSIDTGKVKVLAPEDVRQIIQDAERIAVTKCTCRLTMKKCDALEEICLQVNKGADYTIDRGSGRELTKEEALEIIDQAGKAGLIHVTMNKADVGHFICNCCACCCQAFTMLISDNVHLCDPSRFSPKINSDACTQCGNCIQRCSFNAVSFTDDGTAIVDKSKCLGCGQCAIGCPEEAIEMQVEKDEDFIMDLPKNIVPGINNPSEIVQLLPKLIPQIPAMARMSPSIGILLSQMALKKIFEIPNNILKRISK